MKGAPRTPSKTFHSRWCASHPIATTSLFKMVRQARHLEKRRCVRMREQPAGMRASGQRSPRSALQQHTASHTPLPREQAEPSARPSEVFEGAEGDSFQNVPPGFNAGNPYCLPWTASPRRRAADQAFRHAGVLRPRSLPLSMLQRMPFILPDKNGNHALRERRPARKFRRQPASIRNFPDTRCSCILGNRRIRNARQRGQAHTGRGSRRIILRPTR